MQITAEEISKIMGAPLSNVQKYYPLIIEELRKRNKLKISFLVAILATIGVESGTFKPVREGYWLSPETARRVFNKDYSNRKDLGNKGGDDGYNYRGAGFIQLTGRNNWAKYGLTQENVSDPQKAVEVLISYALDHGLDVWANRAYDKTDEFEEELCWRKVRRLVNGGYNGYPHFRTLVEKFKEAALV